MALLGSISWRSLCIRPGRNSCVAFDRLPEGDSQGSKDFSSGAYGGISLQVEVFPLVLLTPSFWKGLGFRLETGYGRVKKDFVDAGPSSQRVALAIQEVHWSAEVLYRHFFLKPSLDGVGLQASVSLGYAGKNFLSEDLLSGGVSLPDMRRRGMSIGADTELSLSFIRFGLYTHIWIQPKPVGTGYGNVSSKGYKVGGTVSGKVYGPLGYKLDMSWYFFEDVFADKGLPEGGFIRETYLSLRGGLLLEF
jgi:hypothetical protein